MSDENIDEYEEANFRKYQTVMVRVPEKNFMFTGYLMEARDGHCRVWHNAVTETWFPQEQVSLTQYLSRGAPVPEDSDVEHISEEEPDRNNLILVEGCLTPRQTQLIRALIQFGAENLAEVNHAMAFDRPVVDAAGLQPTDAPFTEEEMKSLYRQVGFEPIIDQMNEGWQPTEEEFALYQRRVLRRFMWLDHSRPEAEEVVRVYADIIIDCLECQWTPTDVAQDLDRRVRGLPDVYGQVEEPRPLFEEGPER